MAARSRLGTRGEPQRCRKRFVIFGLVVQASYRVHNAHPPLQPAVAPHAVPALELGAAGEAELLKSVADVKLDRVDADPEARRDSGIAQPVTNSLGYPPLGWCKQVVVRWPSGASLQAHDLLPTGAPPQLPYPVRPSVGPNVVIRERSWSQLMALPRRPASSQVLARGLTA